VSSPKTLSASLDAEDPTQIIARKDTICLQPQFQTK
jgi:hypothetical protein